MIITGSLTDLGGAYRCRFNAIDIETAARQVSPAVTIGNDRIVAYMLPASAAFTFSPKCIKMMDIDAGIEFNQSAFKQGVTEADIRYAFAHRLFERPAAVENNKYLMSGMTEEEADALDELWIKNPSAIDTSRAGHFSERMAHPVEVDNLTVAWLRAKADASHQTPAQIIGELARNALSAST